MTIPVTCATGRLGHLVLDHLQARVPPRSLIALARSRRKAGDRGITVRPFDYARPSGGETPS